MHPTDDISGSVRTVAAFGDTMRPLVQTVEVLIRLGCSVVDLPFLLHISISSLNLALRLSGVLCDCSIGLHDLEARNLSESSASDF